MASATILDSVSARDYLEQVYAGVLGKLIGVYLGRPIEQQIHKDIIQKFGHVRYYLTDQTPLPLVAADDDVCGTFTFIRALEEHGAKADISAEQIGKTWLNNAIEHKCPFWFGGRGYSTEHTAFLNLLHGTPAPRSGSIALNGKTIAEQIGGQIFIDGWGLVAPGQPALAARFADAASSVSHDGEARFAARMWAAMEAEAFISNGVDHLLETGLRFVPHESLLAKVIEDVREWSKTDNDWLEVRQKIEDTYGYEKFAGSCHVIPNHAIMILSLIYGHNSFHEALHIINTCGWDTDCNSGNVGCLLAIMHGLNGIDNGGPDWRGPLADRAIVSGADGGYTVNNATRIAYDIANSGLKLAGKNEIQMPKNGAQFHFDLPGAVQGFTTNGTGKESQFVRVEQANDETHNTGLLIRLEGLDKASAPVEVSTPTFVQPEDRTGVITYPFVGCPLVYPGQRLKARIRADPSNTDLVSVTLRLNVYTQNKKPQEKALYAANPDLDTLMPVDGPSVSLKPGGKYTLEWTIPDNMDHQPIGRVGLAFPAPKGSVDGSVWLHYLRWDGTPRMKIKRPSNAVVNASEVWREAWINNATTFNWYMPSTFGISKDKGEGSIIYGTQEWTNYKVCASDFSIVLATAAGLMVHNQGINRYYALMFKPGGIVAFVKAIDEQRIELATAKFEWSLDIKYEVAIEVYNNNLNGFVNRNHVLQATDDRFPAGGIGMVVLDGAVCAEEFEITPVGDCDAT